MEIKNEDQYLELLSLYDQLLNQKGIYACLSEK
jgi:hypothetical protein